MMDIFTQSHSEIIQAFQALKSGDRREARRLAEKSASLYPTQEEPWLILAAVASPHASIEYLKKALEINPQSEAAIKGMKWAEQRLQSTIHAAEPPLALVNVKPIASDALFRSITPVWFVLAILCILALGAIPITRFARFTYASHGNYPMLSAPITVDKATRTPTLTATYTNTPTNTATRTPVPTDTYIPTSTATQTIEPSLTPEPTEVIAEESSPKNTPRQRAKKPRTSANPSKRPAVVGSNERWIDVDLSGQRTYALQGDELINTFIVSTGTAIHPTVTGTFHIYVKYRSANMSGEDYYLRNVPYVMYFFKDYGLHGTYWHNNFGVPMSHGCINLRTNDAKWLFNWVSVGIVVNIHN